MLKRYLFGLLLCLPLMAYAGGSGEKQAQELLDFLMTGQGDSIYVRFNDNLKGQLSAAMFNDTFSTLEKQVGAYRDRGDWKEDQVSGVIVYYCDLQFERASLRFLTAFDADGKVNTIRFVPVPAAPVASNSMKMNAEKIEEQAIELVCGQYKLSGILTLTKGEQNVPLVILVHGSGPNDRDETIGPNKPFRDLAWGLAERGIASIRYDKRTKVYSGNYAGGNGGTYDDETVDDALAAIDLAKTIQPVNTKQIYIAGHSLGGMLAPRIAERSGELAGIIMMAGNARPLEDLLPEQLAYIASLDGSPVEMKAMAEEVNTQVANLKKLGTSAFDENIPLPFNSPRSYWEFSQTYKQVEVAKKLSLPILILQGERDYQVTMQDFELWQSNLSGKSNVFFKSYPSLNHLFLEGEGKSTPSEYNEEKHIPGYVINDMAGWIKDKNSIKKR